MILPGRFLPSLALASFPILAQFAFGSVHSDASSNPAPVISISAKPAGSDVGELPAHPAPGDTSEFYPETKPLLQPVLKAGGFLGGRLRLAAIKHLTRVAQDTSAEIHIDAGQTATTRSITGHQIARLPYESISDLVSLQPGIVDLRVRGGMISDMEFYLDGIPLRDPLVAYESREMRDIREPGLPENPGADLPDLVISEIELQPGGFSPRYGNSGPAMVNLTTRKASPQHTGRVRITTEGLVPGDWNGIMEKAWFIDPTMFLPPDDTLLSVYIAEWDGFGYSAGDTVSTRTVEIKGGRLRIGDELADAGDIEAIQDISILDEFGREYVESIPIWTETRGDYDRRKISYVFSGPLMENVGYTMAGEYENRDHFNVFGKISSHLSSDNDLMISALWSNVQYQPYYQYNRKYQGGYLPGFGPIYPSFDTVQERLRETVLLTGTWTQSLGTRGQLRITLSHYRGEFEQKRHDYDDRDGDDDRDEYLVFRKITVPRGEPGTEAYEDTSLWRYTTENEDLVYVWTQDPTLVDSVNFPNTYNSSYRGEWKIGNPDVMDDATHLWSENYPSGWKEIWIPVYHPDIETWSYYSDWQFVTGDNQFELTGATHNDLDERIFNVTDSYFHATGDPYQPYLHTISNITTIKADYRRSFGENHLFQAGGEYSACDLSVLGVLTSSLANFYVEDWQRQPKEWALYFNDRLKLSKLQVEMGFRLNAYHLGDDVVYSGVADDPSEFPINQETKELVEPVTWEGPVVSASPSLGAAYPFNDRGVFNFRYSTHHRRPDWAYYYNNLDYNDQGYYSSIGNPELEPIRFEAYEIGLRYKLAPSVLAAVTYFNQDFENGLWYGRGGELPGTKFLIFKNDFKGRTEGVEVTVTRKYLRNSSFNVCYTYMDSRYILPESLRPGGTYLWRQFTANDEYLNRTFYGQKHALQAWAILDMAPNGNPLLLFGNWQLSAVYRYDSGYPVDDSKDRAMRRPHMKSIDLHLAKRISLVGSTAAIWIDVLNVFDERNMIEIPLSLEDPEGRYHDWTFWGPFRRVKVGMDIEW
ncbi:TonB-dependent receptor domain-containing protein [Candidatus Neomarinimicrobiota bacterium]